ncbi:hypothetical protein M885DRAFT_514823 [Pelagophyceae sp. CCMP2097]|nr:hypothetical protein M885DRAFT_514823 [Pelagophyceae sp. CCMP2097]
MQAGVAKGATPAADLRAAVELAHRVVTNLLRNPTDPRLHRLKTTNSHVQKALALPNGAALFKAVGFSDDGAGLLVLRQRGARPPPKEGAANATFAFPKLDPETEAFLYRGLADLETALTKLESNAQAQRLGGAELEMHRSQLRPGDAPTKRKPAGRDALSRVLHDLGDDVQRAQLAMARRAFAAYDVDEDGVVTKPDVEKALRAAGKAATPAAVAKWIKARDLDNDGAVSFDDFLAALAPMFAVTRKKDASARHRRGDALGVVDLGGGDASDVAAAVGALRLGATVREVLQCVAALERRLGAIIDAPQNTQLWRIKVGDAKPGAGGAPVTLEDFVATFAGGVALAAACGFCLEDNGRVLALGSGRAWDRLPAGALASLQVARAELRARSTALEHPDVPDIRAVSAAVARLGGDAKAWVGAVELCVRYSRNALKATRNVRTVPATNAVFQSRILGCKGGLELLVALGWREASGGGSFVLPASTPDEDLEARVLELEAGLPFLRVRAEQEGPDRTAREVSKRTARGQQEDSKRAAPETLPKTKASDAKADAAGAPSLSTIHRAGSKAPAAAQDGDRPASLSRRPPGAEKARLQLAAKQRELEVAQRQKDAAVLQTQRAEAQAIKAKQLADALAAQLHEAQAAAARTAPCPSTGPSTTAKLRAEDAAARTKTATRLGLSAASAGFPRAGPPRPASSRRTALHQPPPRARGYGDVADDGTLVQTSLLEATAAGATFVRIADTHGWRVGSKVRVGYDAACEERFVTGLGSLILNAPLTVPHPAGAPVVMLKATIDERRLFKRARAIAAAHDVLADVIEEACAAGEALLRQRQQQRAFDCRAVAQRRCVLKRVMQRDLAKDEALVGCLPRLGELYVKRGGRVDAYSDGWTLSEARRVFDRVNESGSDVVTENEVERARRAERLGCLDAFAEGGGAALDFGAFLEKTTDGRRRASFAAAAGGADLDWARGVDGTVLDELAAVFNAHAPLDCDHAVLAALRDLEGVDVSSGARTVELPAGFATVVDFARWRCGEFDPSSVLFPSRARGLNGWRRAACLRMRPLWDAADVEALFDRIRSSEAMRTFVLEVLPNGKVLGEAIRDAIVDGGLRAWRDVEALVYGDDAVDVLFKRGPIPKTVASRRRSHPEDGRIPKTVARKVGPHAAPGERAPVVHEVALDEAASRAFVLLDDGCVEAWDAATSSKLLRVPVLVVPGRAADGDVVTRLLLLEPRCQMLCFDAHARNLIVNCTAGDGTLRYHDAAMLRCLDAVAVQDLALRDFDRGLFHDRAGDAPQSSFGAVLAFEVASHADDLLVVAVAGDAALRLVSLSTGAVRVILAGHAAAVTCLATTCPTDAHARAFSGSGDSTIRVWRSTLDADTMRVGDAVRTAVDAVLKSGVPPAWRGATVSGALDDQVFEVEFDDDGAVEFVDKAQLHDARTEPLRNWPKRPLGTRVAVWHAREAQSAQRFFAQFDLRGAGVARAADVEAALGVAVGRPGRTLVTLREFESFARVSSGAASSGAPTFRAAERILRGHGGAITALVYCEATELLASAGADATLRLWEPEPLRHALVVPGAAHHLRVGVGQYRPLNDEWAAASATEKLCVSLDRPATRLRCARLRATCAASPVDVSAAGVREAHRVDAAVGANVQLSGFAYLMRSGGVDYLETTGLDFDDRFVGLRLRDAAFLTCVADDAAKVLLNKRRDVVRVAYFAAADARADVAAFLDDALAWPLAKAEQERRRLGLQLEFVFFACPHDDLTTDVSPTAGDMAAEKVESTVFDECAEVVFAEVGTGAAGSRKAAVGWAVSRLDVGRRAVGDAALDDAAVARAGLAAWSASLDSWRGALASSARAIVETHAALDREAAEHEHATRRWLARVRIDADASDGAARLAFRAAQRSPKYRGDVLRSALLALSVVFDRGGGALQIDEVRRRLAQLAPLYHCAAWAARALEDGPQHFDANEAGAIVAGRGLDCGLTREAAVALLRPLVGEHALDDTYDLLGGDAVVDEATFVAAVRELEISRRLDRALIRPADPRRGAGLLEQWAALEASEAHLAGGADVALRTTFYAAAPLRVCLGRLAAVAKRPLLGGNAPPDRPDGDGVPDLGRPARRYRVVVSPDDDDGAASDGEGAGETALRRPGRRAARLHDALSAGPDCAAHHVYIADDSGIELAAVAFRLRGRFGDAEARSPGAPAEVRASQRPRLVDLAATPAMLACAHLLGGVGLTHAPDFFLDAEHADAGAAPRWLVFQGLEPGSRTLRELLSAHGAPPDAVTRLWFRQMCAAAAHAHRHALVLVTLCAEHVVVSSDGARVRVVPVGLREAGRAAPRCDLDDVSTPPEFSAQFMAEWLRDGSVSAFPRRRRDGRETIDCGIRPTAAWDSWGLGLLLRECARPFRRFSGYAHQVRAHLTATEGRASGFFFDALELKRISGAFAPVEETVSRLEQYATLCDADAALREDAPRFRVVDAVRAALCDANHGLSQPSMRADAIFSALVGLGFELTAAEAEALAARCAGDFYALAALLDEYVAVSTADCYVALLDADAAKRPLAADLLVSPYLNSQSGYEREYEAGVKAALYATGGVVTPRALAKHLMGPLRRLERCKASGIATGGGAGVLDAIVGDFRRVCDGVVLALRSDDLALCDVVFSRNVLERCFDFAATFGETAAELFPDEAFDEQPAARRRRRGDHDGAAKLRADGVFFVVTRLSACVAGALESLATDPQAAVSRLDDDLLDRVVMVAAKLLTCGATRAVEGLAPPGAAAYDFARAGPPLAQLFERTAPQFLSDVVAAVRAASFTPQRARAGAASSVRRGAARALAAAFRGGLSARRSARAFVSLDVGELLLPLAADAGCGDVRIAALQCCLNAVAAAAAAARADGAALGATLDDLDGPRDDDAAALRALLRAFSSAAWVGAISTAIRSPATAAAERGVAFAALAEMVGASDEGMRNFGAGGAIPALFAAKRVVSTPTDLRQDTYEAGGNTHRLLQPFRSANGGATEAHGILELISRSDTGLGAALSKLTALP